MDIKRESIFISAVRTLCKTFAGMLGVIISITMLAMIIGIAIKPMVSDKTQLIIAADAEGNREALPRSTPAILRINIQGVIGSRDLNAKTIEAQLLDSRTGLLHDNRVKALLLYINSPGGTAFDAHDIYTKLLQYKEKFKVPIYAYVDGMCASGAMMIACAADKILSSPIGIIGSVGVLMGPNFNIAGLMEKFGVKQLTLTKGKNKDMLNPYREWNPDEDQSLRDIVDYDYKIFVDLVAKARPHLTRNDLVNRYGAQVYAPLQAQGYGYIDDGNSTYNQSLRELIKEAKIEGDYQVVELKILHPVLSSIIEGKSPIFTGKVKHEFQLPIELSPELMNRPLYLYAPALQSISYVE